MNAFDTHLKLIGFLTTIKQTKKYWQMGPASETLINSLLLSNQNINQIDCFNWTNMMMIRRKQKNLVMCCKNPISEANKISPKKNSIAPQSP